MPSLRVGSREEIEKPDWQHTSAHFSARRKKTTPVNPAALTDARLVAGEAPILWHHVGVVALAGQHLCHVPYPLPLPLLGLQENPKADVCSI